MNSNMEHVELEVRQENYENVDDDMYENEPVQEKMTGNNNVKNKPEQNPTEDGTSGIDDENYESYDVEKNINIKPEIPPKPKAPTKDEDIPLERPPSPPTRRSNTDAIEAPTAQYVDYRQQSDYLIPKDDIGDKKKKTATDISTGKCKVGKRCIIEAVLAATIVSLALVIIGLVVFIIKEKTKDAELQSYVLPMIPFDPDKIHKIYTTPQMKKETLVIISVETKAKWLSMNDKISATKHDIKYVTAHGNTTTWSNFLVQGKADAIEILSDNKVTSIYQQVWSDSFFILPENFLATKYTIASIPHRTDEQNICEHSALVYAKEYMKTTYTNGIGPKAVPINRVGNVETGNVSIEATKMIGVLNMYECKGPKYSHSCDKSYEQVIPDKYLGEEYFVPSFDMEQKNYSSYIIITSPEDGNEIEYMYFPDNQKKEKKFTLKKGEASNEKYTPASIRCSKTCSVSVMIQFQKSVNHTSIALTNIIATKYFLSDKTYFSANMSQASWSNLYLLVVIATGGSDKAHSKLSLDGQQMQSNWNMPSGLGFTFGFRTELQRKTHYLESQGVPYMGYLIGSNSSSCGFAHFIGLNI